MLLPIDRREYILSRLVGKKCDVVPDNELNNSARVIDELEDYGLRLSFLPCVLNLELVLRGSRLYYLHNADTVGNGVEMHKRLCNLFRELCCIDSGVGYLFFLKSRARDVAAAAGEFYGGMLFAKIVDYCLDGDDYVESSPPHTVEFQIDCDGDVNVAQLCTFTVPAAKWNESVLIVEREKARVMTECISVLGFAVSVRELQA